MDIIKLSLINFNEYFKSNTFDELLPLFNINNIFYVNFILNNIYNQNNIKLFTLTTYINNLNTLKNNTLKNTTKTINHKSNINNILVIDGYYIYELNNNKINNKLNNSDINIPISNINNIKDYINRQNNIRIKLNNKYTSNASNKNINTNKASNIRLHKCTILNQYVNTFIEHNTHIKYNIIIYNYFLLYLIGQFKHTFIDKKLIKIHSNINAEEGYYITSILNNINKKNVINCLEIGMAFGTSAAYILLCNENVNLISIDPFQSTQWENNGMNLIKNMKLNKRHKLIEKKSYIALPQLKQTFDLIFIDGWHTFDYTLVDFFYANLLLNINGYIIIDDALHKGVNKCVKYIDTNYKFYKKIESPKTFAIYQKIQEDNRDWFYHSNF